MKKGPLSIVLPTRSVSLFLSYASEDELFCQELEKHLSLLQRQGLISTWYDRHILAGADRTQEIDEQFERASMILLLISADFLASDYCYSQEMMRALERHTVGKAQVVPILMRPCDWHNAPFARLQILPTNARPISVWSDRDEAWTSVVTTIRLALASQLMPSEGMTTSVISDPMLTASLLPRMHSQSPSTLERQNRDLLNASLRGRKDLITLDHAQQERLSEALMDAFPSYVSLKRMVAYKLGINLEACTGSRKLADCVFDLIEHMRSHGRLEDLVRGACQGNPGNQQLRAFAQDHHLKT